MEANLFLSYDFMTLLSTMEDTGVWVREWGSIGLSLKMIGGGE